jgi:hypothetical protein
MDVKQRKPIPCHAKWLDMTPSENGRICGLCNKNIVDFSSMPWRQIEKIQHANSYKVCGMYSKKQLKYWGHEIPHSSFKKKLITSTLATGLLGNVFTQNLTPDTAKQQIVVQGFVTSKSKNGNVDSIGYVNVQLVKTNLWVMTQANGYYSLDITPYVDTLKDPLVLFSSVGYTSRRIQLGTITKKEYNINIELEEAEINIQAFSVRKPSMWQKLWWWIKRPFMRS